MTNTAILPPNYTFDHIGIAVRNLGSAIAFYENSFNLKCVLREKIESQGVEVAFIELPNTKIELLAPLSSPSKLTTFLEKRGEGLHHVCYRVSDIVAELSRLAALGFELLDKTPRKGAHNSQIAFIHPKSCQGVLTELCQY